LAGKPGRQPPKRFFFDYLTLRPWNSPHLPVPKGLNIKRHLFTTDPADNASNWPILSSARRFYFFLGNPPLYIGPSFFSSSFLAHTINSLPPMVSPTVAVCNSRCPMRFWVRFFVPRPKGTSPFKIFLRAYYRLGICMSAICFSVFCLLLSELSPPGVRLMVWFNPPPLLGWPKKLKTSPSPLRIDSSRPN